MMNFWSILQSDKKNKKKNKESVNKYGSASIFSSRQCGSDDCANTKKTTLIESLITEAIKSTFPVSEAFSTRCRTAMHLVSSDSKGVSF